MVITIHYWYKVTEVEMVALNYIKCFFKKD